MSYCVSYSKSKIVLKKLKLKFHAAPLVFLRNGKEVQKYREKAE